MPRASGHPVTPRRFRVDRPLARATTPRLSFEDRPQVLKLVEKMPDIVAAALLAVRMQVGDSGIIAVAVEGFLRRPFDQDHHGARLDVAGGRLAELAERNDA